MSRGIASFLILIISIQQIVCQNDFQNQVLERLGKLESENTSHQATVNYDMPLHQMKKLFEVSGGCSQEVQFHCKSAPLQVSTRKSRF